VFQKVQEFEISIANFFGAPYAVATDCCTHAIELCLRYKNVKQSITVPKHTYLSVPMTAKKLGLGISWIDCRWGNYYCLSNSIYDAAVLWESNSYITNSLMCISFQHSKHLKLGRGGAILCQTLEEYEALKATSYDGRNLSIAPWGLQNIITMGYHYYMTPETAQMGLDKLPEAIISTPKLWSYKDYPDISKMSVFNE
jgi:dTDP-4-amino-4,6-dideoxygalactose transaminase